MIFHSELSDKIPHTDGPGYVDLLQRYDPHSLKIVKTVR